MLKRKIPKIPKKKRNHLVVIVAIVIMRETEIEVIDIEVIEATEIEIIEIVGTAIVSIEIVIVIEIVTIVAVEITTTETEIVITVIEVIEIEVRSDAPNGKNKKDTNVAPLVAVDKNAKRKIKSPLQPQKQMVEPKKN